MFKDIVMKSKILIALLMIIIVGCNKEEEQQKPGVLTLKDMEVLHQGNLFGFNLYDKILDQYADSSLCISPYSIYTAVSMAANGADGKTLEEMMEVLGFPGQNVDMLNTSLKNLNMLLVKKDAETVFETANSVWYNTDGFEVFPDFVAAMTDYYDAVVEGRDFSDSSTLPEINGWVKDKTHEKIEKIIERINRDDVCYLINALYFNGKWATVFDREKTHDGFFTGFNGKTVEVPTMYLEDTFGIIINDRLSAVELPYGDGSWAMYLILPPRGTSPAEWCRNELFTGWDEIRGQFAAEKVEIYLPQFKLENSFELSKQLKMAGMPTAFTNAADFSNLGPGSLAISQVLHKTFIDVNEEGTEAAAVTAVIITRTSMPDSEIRFSRPFVYLIAEKTTGSIIFLGQITKLP